MTVKGKPYNHLNQAIEKLYDYIVSNVFEFFIFKKKFYFNFRKFSSLVI